ncbi:unnamed protein product [Prunus brigantina]
MTCPKKNCGDGICHCLTLISINVCHSVFLIYLHYVKEH